MNMCTISVFNHFLCSFLSMLFPFHRLTRTARSTVSVASALVRTAAPASSWLPTKIVTTAASAT